MPTENDDIVRAVAEEIREIVCSDDPHIHDAKVFVNRMRNRGYIIIKSGFVPKC